MRNGENKMCLQFYDFEVFKYNWIVVIIDPFEKTTTVISDDKNKLSDYYELHKNDIWVGYNSRSYDQYIFKAILLDINPKEVNDFIIRDGRKGWEYSSLFNSIPLYNYDCMPKGNSLKQLEAFMNNDIQETSVPFDIDRPLTDMEIKETVKYCTHDVEQTMQVFLKTKETFEAHLGMLKTFNMPINYISKTQAQLSSKALECTPHDYFDEWNISIIDTLRIKKYKHVVNWFRDPDNHNYEKNLITDVCGVPHIFGWGGLHGAIGEITYNRNGTPSIKNIPVHRKGLIIHVDVTSFYPSIMIRYNLLSRSVKDKSAYKKIYDTRVALKKAGKKEEQAPYKIILNSTYGICKDPTSAAYDPRRANEVCINGQLLLLDLLEHLEGHCEVIQSNTDGLIIQIPDTDEAFNEADDICYEWEHRTGMSLGFDIINEIWQGDVNNYIFRFEDGKLERKGAYVKELSSLDNDLAIVNTAIVKYLTEGVPVETTVNDCDDLSQFQKVVKVSSKYLYGYHNGKKLQGKTFRVFASKNKSDGFIGKVKIKKGVESIEKFANTPEHCFIRNGDIKGQNVPFVLDKRYYVDLAKERVKNKFGL